MSWEHLLFRANDMLRKPHVLSSLGRWNLLQFLVREPSSIAEAWHVVSSPENRKLGICTVIHLIWDPVADFPDVDELEQEGFEAGTDAYLQALEDKMPVNPTIVEHQYQADISYFLRQISMFKQIRIPSNFEIEPPTGANSYEIILGNIMNGLSFRWWHPGPPEWGHEITIIYNIIGHLRKIVNWSSNIQTSP